MPKYKLFMGAFELSGTKIFKSTHILQQLRHMIHRLPFYCSNSQTLVVFKGTSGNNLKVFDLHFQETQFIIDSLRSHFSLIKKINEIGIKVKYSCSKICCRVAATASDNFSKKWFYYTEQSKIFFFAYTSNACFSKEI